MSTALKIDQIISLMRRGQEGAVRTVVERCGRGESHTSLVLPTRYGKTDVARVCAMYLKSIDAIHTTLFVTCTDFLRGQAVKRTDWAECLLRYSIKYPVKFRPILALEESDDYTPNGELFLSVTIQLVSRNLPVFCDWVSSVFHKTGKRVLVWYDEAHTGSEQNSWGEALEALSKAGAIVILSTATAFRSDGQRCFGFEWEETDVKPDDWRTVRPGSQPDTRIVDYWSGTKSKLRLRSDWETTFRQAWSETPSPLCTLERVPFDVPLIRVLPELQPERAGTLKEQSATIVRRVLDRLVRHPFVIQEGVKRTIADLKMRRFSEPTAAAITFCGNDVDENEAGVNAHARAIEREFRRQAPELTCIIATSRDGNAAGERIRQFASGNVGDVLIVKQMASLGLDAPRLKTCLDLSAIRAAAASIQRWMRVCTPFGRLRVAALISPDDVISREQYEVLVADQGGGQTRRAGEVVESIEVPVTPKPPTPLLVPDRPIDSDFEDSEGNQAEGAEFPTARRLLKLLPELGATRSHAALVKICTGISFAEDEVVADTYVHDVSADIEGLRSEISAAMSEIVNVRWRRAGRRYTGSREDSERFGRDMTDVYGVLYGRAGVPWGTKLDRITDLRVLVRLQVTSEQMRAEEFDDHADAESAAG